MVKGKVYMLTQGHFDVDKGLVITGGVDVGKVVRIPDNQYYIEHPDARIVVDTGVNPDYRKLWHPLAQQAFPFTIAKSMEDCLKSVNVKPEDIDIVINTHLHLDHAGNNKLFKNATFISQKAEMQGALIPEWFSSISYVREDFDPYLHPELKYELVDGEYEVVKDVWVFPTPGHTVGHQAIFMRLEGSNYIITGDAIYTRENAEGPCLPGLGLFVNPMWWSNSMKDIMHRAKIEKATLLWMHDPVEFPTMKKPPEYYS